MTPVVPPAGMVSAGQVHWLTVAFMLLLYIALLAGTVYTLKRDGTWSLAKALSEGGEPSTSRLIAFMGLQVMLVLYIGIGNIMIWRMVRGDAVDLPSFFLMGLALFAPYAVSQFRAAVTGLTSAALVGPLPPAGFAITGIQPASVKAGIRTLVTLTGSGFTADTKVMLTTAAGSPMPVAVESFQAGSLTFFVIARTGTAAFDSKVTVTNSTGQQQTTLRVEP